MKLRWLTIIGLVLACLTGAPLDSRADAQKDAADARQMLRKQGFKTDLLEFDFSTDTQTALRAAALTNTPYTRPTVLLQPVGPDSAIAAWKEPTLPEETEGYQNLPPVEQVLATNGEALDLACAAALAGPIAVPLNASHGSAMLLVHLAPLRHLSDALAARVIIDLRENRYGAAWTNLLALTRLATAWVPEPCEVSHRVRFTLAQTAWKAAWQALQAHNWSPEQLRALQHEWEAADFFKNLPETMAFKRACAVDTCVRERQAPAPPGPRLKDTLENVLHSPGSLASEAKYRWDRAQYRATGTYEDERDLLLFYRDREVEVRRAIAASTWLQMRVLPGVTNAMPFRSKYGSSMQAMLNSRELALAFQLRGKGLLARAAETEARRRLVIAALALERYRLAHAAYPKDLQSLVPEVLSAVPVDFMDGKPLRYRLNDVGAFVLYSVGLDCIDDGGNFALVKNPPPQYPNPDPADGPDLVWPRESSDAETQSFKREQARTKQELEQTRKQQARQDERQAEQRRQEIMTQLAELYAKGDNPKIIEPKLDGEPLSQLLRNKAIPGPAPGIDQMLTLRQVAIGKEPDIATFELPISYDALTNTGTLRLLCDSDPSGGSAGDAAEFQECERATNDNCRLLWNTSYDPPGRHFLQAELRLDSWHSRSRRRGREAEETVLRGPLFSFVSTNVMQFLPMDNLFTDKGAFFHVKLAQPVGSYTLELTSPSGEHIHTFTGSTTNGVVEFHWDLTYDGGKRYTNDSFNSSWTVTFPEAGLPSRTNAP